MNLNQDGPDTRLAYKRSIDGGAQWSPVKIFLQHQGDPAFRAENGECQSQAAPFIDPSSKMLFVAFNQVRVRVECRCADRV